MIRKLLGWIFSLIGFIVVLFVIAVAIAGVITNKPFGEQLVAWINVLFGNIGKR